MARGRAKSSRPCFGTPGSKHRIALALAVLAVQAYRGRLLSTQ